MKTIKNISSPIWLLLITFFIAGIFLGGIVIYLWTNINKLALYKIHSTTKYTFINPLLAIDTKNQGFAINRTLDLNLRGYLDEKKREGFINSVSLYFRDLEGSNWLGINEDEKFSPGKLLNIPIMIAYFRLAEQNPEILSQELTYTGPDANNDEIFKTPAPLAKNKSYSVNELIEKMIANNDNNAANLLFDFIDKLALNEVFSDLGIGFKEDKSTPDFIGVKTYALFYRILYNATYLNNEYSERALELLSKVDYPSIGFDSLLPKSSYLSYDYDARIYEQGGQKITELYSCGVIYYPQYPYLLCAALRGKDIKQLEDILSNINSITYNDVGYRYSQQ